MKKIIFATVFIISVILSVYALSIQKNLSDELLRMHIIANSNSKFDQNLKIQVRDKICETVGKEFINIKDKKEYRKTLIEKCEEIQAVADEILDKNNAGYKSNVTFGKLYIPRKTYNEIVLPEGSYDGLVIRLGNASGKNWWCVVYPPLCFTENSSGKLSTEAMEYLKNNLSAESYSLITKEGIDIKYKFKLIEIFQKLKNFTSENKLH